MPSKGGCPPRLAAEKGLQRAIVEHVKAGEDWRAAHIHAGASRRSAYRWRNDPRPPYQRLQRAIERAQVQAERERTRRAPPTDVLLATMSDEINALLARTTRKSKTLRTLRQRVRMPKGGGEAAWQ